MIRDEIRKRQRTAMDAAILNHALEMALEWGENFHKPIQERLRNAYPALTPAAAKGKCSLPRTSANGRRPRRRLRIRRYMTR